MLTPFKRQRLAAGEQDVMIPVPDPYLKTAVFLCAEEDIDGAIRRVPRATGFLVRVDIEETPYCVEYLVTARHCLHAARGAGHKHLWLRANTRDDKFVEVPVGIDDWFESDEADVAAVRIAQRVATARLPGGGFDVTGIRFDAFVGPGPDYKWEGVIEGIGPQVFQPRVGHEIYFPGLFTQHHGASKNLPIVRFGHISQMPNIVKLRNPDKSTSEVIAYLAEFQSWGGHNGSPVFFEYPLNVIRDVVSPSGQKHLQADTAFISGFMGLCSGHFDIPKDGKTTKGMGTVRTDLNSGIAVVTPAQAVRDLLMRGDVVEERSQVRKRVADREPSSATPDSAMPTADGGVESLQIGSPIGQSRKRSKNRRKKRVFWKVAPVEN